MTVRAIAKELPLLAVAALGAVKLGSVLDLAAASVLPAPSSARLELFNWFAKCQTPAQLAAGLAFGVVAVPIFQEYVFRKSSLYKIHTSPAPAFTLVSAAVFFSFFQSGQSFIAGLLGIAFGLAYLHTGSLIPGIVANGSLRLIQSIEAFKATRGPRFDVPLDPPITGDMIKYAAIGALALAAYVWLRRAAVPARAQPEGATLQ